MSDPSLATVWSRITAHSGQSFTLTRGQKFTYSMYGAYLLPDGRARRLSLILIACENAQAEDTGAAAREHAISSRPAGLLIRLFNSYGPPHQPGRLVAVAHDTCNERSKRESSAIRGSIRRAGEFVEPLC